MTISLKGDKTLEVIGLTGGIASGKSTVSRYLEELGAAIIDADSIARQLVQPHKPAWKEIKDCFGSDVFDEKGNLNRKKMAELIFTSPVLREKLNSIIHPKVIAATRELIKEKKREAVPLIVVDAPLLIEAGMTDLVDKVWVIAVPEEVQLDRLMERDGLTREQALKRLRSQMPLQEKLAYADRVIDNSGSPEQTRRYLKSLYQEAVSGEIKES